MSLVSDFDRLLLEFKFELVKSVSNLEKTEGNKKPRLKRFYNGKKTTLAIVKGFDV